MVVRCLQSKIKAPHVALGVWARAVKEYERGVMSETVDKIIIITMNKFFAPIREGCNRGSHLKAYRAFGRRQGDSSFRVRSLMLYSSAGLSPMIYDSGLAPKLKRQCDRI